MNDKRFEGILKQLPQVLNDSLKNLEFTEEMRQAVRERLCDAEIKEIKQRRSFLPIPAVLLLVVCIFGASIFIQRWNKSAIQTIPQVHSPMFIQLETIDIDMDGKGQLEMVNTWKMREPNSRESLIALVWVQDTKGDWYVVSTQPFYGKDFLPIEILSPPSLEGNLVVIASTDEKNQVYYRVLGYDGSKVLAYLEKKSIFYDVRKQMLQEIEGLLSTGIKK